MSGVAPRKLSALLPEPLRPMATRLGLAWKGVQERVRDLGLMWHERRGAIVHLSGPADIEAAPGEVFVVCMVRNGMTWLPTWLSHYRSLGADHLVILDNGSTDGTVELASQGDDTTVFRCELSYGDYFVAFARWLHRRFAGEGWILLADIDELLNYPYDDRLPLPELAAYLDSRDYSAMVVQNLEMISAAPLRTLEAPADGDLRGTYDMYEISDVERIENKYWRWMNRGVTPAHLSHTGGVRTTFFDWRGSMLTKLALCKPSAGVSVYPYDNHFVTRAHVADVTGVFRHFKYIHSFVEQVRIEAEREEHYNDARMFKSYARKLAEEPDLALTTETSERWEGAEKLLESGYVLASDEYREWVARYTE